MLRLTYTLSLLWAAFMMGLSSYLDLSFSKLSNHFKADRTRDIWRDRRDPADIMGQPAATDVSQRARRVINPASPIGEPEDYARVGLNDYYRDLDRCVIPIWTPEMDLLPVWQFECMMALMDAPIDVEGNRLIHAAARSANQHALAVLVDLGVRTNCPNYAGKTPRDVLRCYDTMNRTTMLARLDRTHVPVPGNTAEPGETTQPGGMVATRPESTKQPSRTGL